MIQEPDENNSVKKKKKKYFQNCFLKGSAEASVQEE